MNKFKAPLRSTNAPSPQTPSVQTVRSAGDDQLLEKKKEEKSCPAPSVSDASKAKTPTSGVEPPKNKARKSMMKISAPNRISKPKAPISRVEHHKNTARKSMPKLSAPNTTSKPKKSRPAKFLNAQQEERIFYKAINPSPAPSILIPDVQDASTIKIEDDITASDFEYSDDEMESTLKNNDEDKANMGEQKSNTKKTPPPRASESQVVPSTSKVPDSTEKQPTYKINITKSATVQKLRRPVSVDVEKLSSSPTDSDIEDLSLDAAPSRAFPVETLAPTSRIPAYPSRRLTYEEISEKSDFPVDSGKDVSITPANIRTDKRSLDYDETPVSRFSRKKISRAITDTTDEEKENTSEYTGRNLSQQRSQSSSSSFHSANLDVVRTHPFADKSNTSASTSPSSSVARGPTPFDNIDPVSSGLPISPKPPKAPRTHKHKRTIQRSKTPSTLRNEKPSSEGSQKSSPLRAQARTVQEDEIMRPPSSLVESVLSQALSQVSTYSLPASQLSTEEKLDWLISRRMVGTWVQCDGCKKWRYLKNTHDPTVLPDLWYCNLNPDIAKNHCEADEERMPLKDEALMIRNDYAPGSIVWARVDGWPWWPAIVDDDPDCYQYYWFDDGASEIPTQYHVVFFDTRASRDWLTTDNIRRFRQEPVQKKSKKVARLQYAKNEAERAFAMPQEERVRKYGTLARFRGKFGYLTKKKATKKAPAREKSPVAEIDSEIEEQSTSTVY